MELTDIILHITSLPQARVLSLEPDELGFTSDTHELWIGAAAGSYLLATGTLFPRVVYLDPVFAIDIDFAPQLAELVYLDPVFSIDLAFAPALMSDVLLDPAFTIDLTFAPDLDAEGAVLLDPSFSIDLAFAPALLVEGPLAPSFSIDVAFVPAATVEVYLDPVFALDISWDGGMAVRLPGGNELLVYVFGDAS